MKKKAKKVQKLEEISAGRITFYAVEVCVLYHV
jgi:hypothetical protein